MEVFMRAMSGFVYKKLPLVEWGDSKHLFLFAIVTEGLNFVPGYLGQHFQGTAMQTNTI
jgi:hypothetical protein